MLSCRQIGKLISEEKKRNWKREAVREKPIPHSSDSLGTDWISRCFGSGPEQFGEPDWLVKPWPCWPGA